MSLILVGMNHKTAPLEIRERLSLICVEGGDPLVEVVQIPGVEEALFLSTCNRVEILARIASREAAEGLTGFIFRYGNLDREEMLRCLYAHYDREAVRHLFRVASSLDSLVMGEPQILGQVKDAYRRAAERRTTGVVLNKLIHHAFRAAKRVRTETGIAANAVSVSFAAVELAKKIFGSLRDKTILLIGAGEMSELAARNLLGQGAPRLLVANRTHSRALQLAEEFRGEAVPFEALTDALQEADIVISSTGAAGWVVSAPMVAAALRRRKNRLLFLIDIAVPRDIEPAAGDIDNVYLYNIDHLQEVVDENVRGRLTEARKAEDIVAEEVLRYEEWQNTLEVVPTIVSLREKVDGIVQGEMDRVAAWLEGLSDEDRERVHILASSIVNKILHDPITGLKEESQDSTATPYAEALRRLFRLDGGE
jgi:glutamyl-tRNA reductase